MNITNLDCETYYEIGWIAGKHTTVISRGKDVLNEVITAFAYRARYNFGEGWEFEYSQFTDKGANYKDLVEDQGNSAAAIVSAEHSGGHHTSVEPEIVTVQVTVTTWPWKYAFDGVVGHFKVRKNVSYIFDLTENNNRLHPFRIRLTSDKSTPSGFEVLDEKATWLVPEDWKSGEVEFFCTRHRNMGNIFE